MTHIELVAARAIAAAALTKIDAEIEARNRAHRDDRIAEVRALMIAHGLTMSDISQVRSVTSAGAATKARAPVKPKYRDPQTGVTWTGRGRRPIWFITATASGATFESLKIAA